MPIRIVLADDHPLILDGLENLFRLQEDFQVVARCTNGNDTLEAVKQRRPDVLILDIRMPGKNGLEVFREIQRENLPTRVVLLTAAIDQDELIEAIRMGVHGIVLKDLSPQLLIQCVRKVCAGEQWLERNSVREALERMLRQELGRRQVTGILTPQEITIVQMVAKGMRNKEIAEALFITEGTVKVHLHHIYEKLHIDNRLALLRYAQEKGLV
jgi:DNA-binding NarL/FixJ family response regulator